EIAMFVKLPSIRYSILFYYKAGPLQDFSTIYSTFFADTAGICGIASMRGSEKMATVKHGGSIVMSQSKA
ncbi:MAG: hypothetical protein Q4C72_07700, partial [Eubacteriales bacterium]|nr:hypothetical protein [Eubacteriales bacterium]